MKTSKFKWISLSPIVIYTFILIALPLMYIFFLSFLTNDSYGGVKYIFTFQNYLDIINFTYIKVFIKSFAIALLTAFICICIAYPFSLFVAEKKPQIRSLLIVLVMVPFLTNSLIRMYGWIVLLRKEGIINTVLQKTNIIDAPLQLMYNDLGIIIGMVYTLLPFMILPLYSSALKINPSLIEAAKDLGANKIKIFFRVTIPQTISGLFNGTLMVFIPAIGYFFVSDILGGGKLMILGNLIKNQFLTARNWPFGAAISILLILITLGIVKLYKKSGGNMDDLGGGV